MRESWAPGIAGGVRRWAPGLQKCCQRMYVVQNDLYGKCTWAREQCVSRRRMDRAACVRRWAEDWAGSSILETLV